MTLGTSGSALGIPILALWLPLGERPGIGTLLNVLFIGTSTNAAWPSSRSPGRPARRAPEWSGHLVIAIGSGLYLAADLGPGPRDGLMTGLHHKFGWSIRRARTAIELTVLVAGYLLGGTVRAGHGPLRAGDRTARPGLAERLRPGRPGEPRERVAIGEPGAMPGE